MANDNPNYLFSHWSSQSHNLLPNVQNDMVNYTVQNNDTIIAHYDEIDTLWVITKPDNVATLHIGNDIVNTSPYMGLYQKSTIIPIKAFPNGNNVFNEWRLNNNNLPDYNTQTFFNFINDDTLFAYFNNVLSIEQLDNDFTLAQVYPSIVENDFTIQLESKETLAITIDLYDVLGKKIETLYQGLVSNNALFKQDYSLLQPKGVYIVQLKYKNAVANFKLIKN